MRGTGCGGLLTILRRCAPSAAGLSALGRSLCRLGISTAVWKSTVAQSLTEFACFTIRTWNSSIAANPRVSFASVYATCAGKISGTDFRVLQESHYQELVSGSSSEDGGNAYRPFRGRAIRRNLHVISVVHFEYVAGADEIPRHP